LTMQFKEDTRPKCRACFIPLTTFAEQAIGCHISCVQEARVRERRFRMRSPGYSWQGDQKPRVEEPDIG
jgi:hypothetical protein